MSSLRPHADPEELGFDSHRLSRIDDFFNDFVDQRKLSGWLATVSRGGQLAYVGKGGHADRELDKPVQDDTIWRIYSMTKPITTIAAMMLHEEGKFDLNDSAGKWIEALREPRVYSGGAPANPTTVAATEPVRIWHLMSHMAGLTYGFTYGHNVDAIYRLKGYEFGWPKDATLEQAVNDWCTSPLLFNPGEAWNYSVATDVLGYLVELWSGMSLGQFFQERILGPLKMYDTSFFAPEEKHERVAQLYIPVNGEAFPYPKMGQGAYREGSLESGGGGLVSTAHDYNRFLTMLLNGGELDGVRLVSPRTISLMTENFLPGNQDLTAVARDSFSETEMSGMGFGLGFAVLMDRARNATGAAEGLFTWGGAASTTFWVDPVEDLTVTFFTQLLPSSTYPVRRHLQQVVYQALVD